MWSAQPIPAAVNLDFLDQSCYFFPSTSLIMLMRLSGLRFRPAATQKTSYRLESNPGTLDLQSGTLVTGPPRQSKMYLRTPKLWPI
jgi:hypothetical protein